MTENIRLLIVDDHKLVREGIKAFIAPSPGLEVVGEAENGKEALLQVKRIKPDVILLDLIMPEMDGIETTKAIKKEQPEAKIIIITSFIEEKKVVEAIKAGASGYLLKDSSPLEIETAIKNVHDNETAFTNKITGILAREVNKAHKKEEKIILSEREMEILKLLGQGLSNQDIADQLFLSVWTIRTYVTSILTKLEVENRTQAALYAIKEGLIKLEE